MLLSCDKLAAHIDGSLFRMQSYEVEIKPDMHTQENVAERKNLARFRQTDR